MTGWIATEDEMPEAGQMVDWISPGGQQVNGGRFTGGAIWMLPDGHLYVYYMPTLWRVSARAADIKKATKKVTKATTPHV
jgi:hypothetical protein